MLLLLSRSSLLLSGIKRGLFDVNLHLFTRVVKRQMAMGENTVAALVKQLAPPLASGKYKGQAGRVGVFGGSLEYTGAPYFASISALRVGADLSHVFCMKEAATVIKSYSPELIVHPLLDAPDASAQIEPWLDRLHVILIGPGLGRDPATFQTIEQVVEMCKTRKKPLVIDADGLFLVSQKPQILQGYPAPVVLTPNAMEFSRLVHLDITETSKPDANKRELAKNFLSIAENITILVKGRDDEIFNAETGVTVSGGGSGRRCGGQGDLLGGSLATFLGWALETLDRGSTAKDHRPIVAGSAACRLTRTCNEKGFKKHGRSMICSDMINEIHEVFEELYEVE